MYILGVDTVSIPFMKYIGIQYKYPADLRNILGVDTVRIPYMKHTCTSSIQPTSGISLVWIQSMGLPTYCLAETMREKANMQVVVTL